MRSSPFISAIFAAIAAIFISTLPVSASGPHDPDKEKKKAAPTVRGRVTRTTLGENGMATLSGRAVTPGGKFIRNAAIILMEMETGSTQATVTGSLGFYQLRNIIPGNTYILMVFHSRYLFASPTQVIEINKDIPDMVLIGEMEPIL